jgi:predicted DNA-binding protein with PD1-like motif
MHARRSGSDWFLHVEPGVQLHDAYRAFAREHGVRGAVIAAGIGMLRDPELGYWDGQQYQKRLLRGAFELVSTQGNLGVLDGEPFAHVHVSVAGPDHAAHGGHLFRGEVHVSHEGSVRVLEGVELRRAREPGSPLATLRW